MRATLSGLWLMSTWIVFPYLFAVAMPSWRWLIGCTLLAGGALSYVWIDHWLAMQQPGYNEGPGGAIGIAIFFAMTLGFAGGVVVRAVSLIVAAYRRPKLAFAICTFGLAVPYLVVAIPAAWEAWDRRAASEACITRGFGIEIGRTQLDIPASSLFTVYRGPSARADAFHLINVKQVRALCGVTDDGATRVLATNIAVRFTDLIHGREDTCGPAPPAWATKFCAASDRIRSGRIDDTDYPITAHVFSPGEVKLGEFLGSASSYQDSLAPPHGDERFTTANTRSPDGNPLTLRCRRQSDGSHWCSTSYPWMNGAHVNYVFRSAPDKIAQRGERVDAALRAFLEGLRPK